MPSTPSEPFVVAHLSDLHIGEPTTSLDELIGPAGRLEHAVRRLNDLGVDLVIITGDLVDHGLATEYDRLRALLVQLQPRCILQPGNHDDVAVLHDLFDDVEHLPAPPAAANFVIDDLPLRIVGLDTIQRGFHHGALDAERLAWLSATLEAEPDRPTLLCLHHPPVATGMWWMDYGGFAGAAELEATIRANPQVVRILAGHIHRATDLSFGGTVLGVAPSLSYESMPALRADALPLINNDAPTIPLARWDGERLVTLHVPLDEPTLTLDLRDLIPNWPAYATSARAGGPMPADGFGG